VGGTGRVGRRVVENLTAAGVRVRVLTRDAGGPAAASLLAACPGVEVARGDVTEDDTSALRAAVQGCTQVVAGPGRQCSPRSYE